MRWDVFGSGKKTLPIAKGKILPSAQWPILFRLMKAQIFWFGLDDTVIHRKPKHLGFSMASEEEPQNNPRAEMDVLLVIIGGLGDWCIRRVLKHAIEFEQN